MSKPCKKCGSENRNASGGCRPCQKVRGDKHYKANSEKVKASATKYTKTHPENRKATQIKYNKNHPEVRPASVVKYRKAHPEKEKIRQRKNHLKASYGITQEDKEQILLSQNNACPICNKKLELLGLDSHIDHNHETDKIRGILCRNCNLMLGLCKDNTNILSNAIAYLEKNNG